MFIQPCFIRKNTPELIKKLEELGYNRHPSYGDNGQYLYLNRGFYHTNVIGYSEEIERMIDCGTNEQLFLALAALRDDSDKNQYWICDKVSVTIGKTYYPGDYIYYQYDEFFDKQNWHKVTVEEIIKYFKVIENYDTRRKNKKYADELGQQYFPNEHNIWARKNIEAEFVSSACMRMAKYVEQELIENVKKWLFINTYRHSDDDKLSMTFKDIDEAFENFEKMIENDGF